ncbi:NAD(P)/FAD-dependent oxidoreductase [Polymorphobacter arshaanensis]|uniref:NAD(P)/FAD-dependent oxidoreductase n=1 Tax=Glacieibacterium arshaanense TaxID=2511025 RepID=A0A4Y9EQQ9_9SPHN|nr:NAD(P)/FAD-dependent oxidoreductase [Polymorphobacter arshaanensis]TFU05957.1 NAD(P)/FAD-dependent oxidoreductase [Polymorphobacter arshaanensis]
MTVADGVYSEVDVVVVGAGFAGMYMLHRLRGMGMTAKVFEAGSGVGGTWFWNRYPGARVDIQSLEYSFSFDEQLEREWRWSERYAPQAELLDYANHVADRYDLRRDIQLDTRVNAAHFDETANRWTVTTDRGDTVSARHVVMATGCLSVPTDVDFAGIDSFKGTVYRTSRWPHEGVDFTGQRVGIIGTGSSAIQSIPIIAEQAKQLTVFQRTPNYSVPAHNQPLAPELVAEWDANRTRYRAERRYTAGGFWNTPRDQLTMDAGPDDHRAEYEKRWQVGGFDILGAFADQGVDPNANKVAAEFAAAKIRELVKDPKVADLLTPKDYPFGTKRLCVDTNYYATYNRDNVSLVDIKATPIETITPTGIRTSGGDYEFDSIILATGFDAMTGALARIDIRGRGGETLKSHWAEGPRNYLGLMVAGFPNLYTITGPGSPSVLTNMIMSIEQHVDFIADTLAAMAGRQQVTIEPTAQAEAEWTTHVNELAAMTLYPQANSWYMGANVPGKPRVFLPYVGGLGVYRLLCDKIAADGYTGFALGNLPTAHWERPTLEAFAELGEAVKAFQPARAA